MIHIKNTQRKIKINEKKIKACVQQILDICQYQDFDIGIWFTTNKTIQKFNKTYRKKDKPTDILSFSFHTDLKAGEKIKTKTDDDKNLGDLIISAEFAQNDAKKGGRSLHEHLKILLVHGICHLLGYDHTTESDYKKMRTKELGILKKIVS